VELIGLSVNTVDCHLSLPWARLVHFTPSNVKRSRACVTFCNMLLFSLLWCMCPHAQPPKRILFIPWPLLLPLVLVLYIWRPPLVFHPQYKILPHLSRPNCILIIMFAQDTVETYRAVTFMGHLIWNCWCSYGINILGVFRLRSRRHF
jgi:hypothetical protein